MLPVAAGSMVHERMCRQLPYKNLKSWLYSVYLYSTDTHQRFWVILTSTGSLDSHYLAHAWKAKVSPEFLGILSFYPYDVFFSKKKKKSAGKAQYIYKPNDVNLRKNYLQSNLRTHILDSPDRI